MKVICINNGILNDHRYSFTEGRVLIEGETYTVIGEGINPTTGNENYILAEVKSTNRIGGFNKTRFIPLSSIDETSMIQYTETEKQLL